MTDTDIDRLSEALRELPGDLTPSPMVLTNTYRRAARLRRQRRAALAGTLALVLVIGGLVGHQVLTQPGPPSRTAGHTAGDLLTEPTRGDLAGDTGYRAKVIAAWQASRGLDPGAPGPKDPYQLTGAPTVLLAQQTPAGPAAIVAQRIEKVTPLATGSTRVAPSDMPSQMVTVGYIATGADGKVTVVDADTQHTGSPLVGLAFLVGADRSWLVTVSEGSPLSLSTGRVYHSNSPVTRNFRPIALNAGIAVVSVPAAADRTALAVAAPPATRFDDGVQIFNAQRNSDTRTTEHRLPWYGQLWALPNERAADAAWGIKSPRYPDKANEAWERVFNNENADPFAYRDSGSVWYAYGALPDGRAFVVGDGAIGDDPSYLYGAIIDHGKQTVLYGNKVDPAAVLPVKLRFPDAQGWLVAAKGAVLQYRIGLGAWQAAGTNAALLPANATAVQVTPANHQPTTITLA